MAILDLATLAKAAAPELANAPNSVRSDALRFMARALLANGQAILRANACDVEQAQANGLAGPFIKRLTLDERKLKSMAHALLEIAAMGDVLGDVIETIERPNGLVIRKIRVSLGVIGVIYESRPNVTSDVAGLCIKTGNAVVLRGGSETLGSNQAIVAALRTGVKDAGLNPDCIQLVTSGGRAEVRTMTSLRGLIDVVIPRGGAGLIREVVNNSLVPVIETGAGNCHIYVDCTADVSSAVEIAVNAKCSNPSVCNAMETLLVHEGVAGEFLPRVLAVLHDGGVEIRGCHKTRSIAPWVQLAEESDWREEYLDLIVAVRVVDGLEQAISHINCYGTKHSEAIITQDSAAAQEFTSRIDAACVYVNASTRFTDGGEFGFGAEIGISTQKLHARGPMGIRELTSHKYVIQGSGQVR